MKRDSPVPSEPDGKLLRRDEQPPREFHELWFMLSKKNWRSVVLVPADAGGSASAFATSLAQVGKQLHDFPVTLFIMTHRDDYWPAMQMVNTAAADGPSEAEPAAREYASAVQVVASATRTNGARPPSGKVIVAIQPVVVEPLGLAVTQAADTVVLCIEMGRTHLKSARRTIELVGRERIAGCLIDYTKRRAPRRTS